MLQYSFNIFFTRFCSVVEVAIVRMSEQYGLGDTAMLAKVDKLFACGVGDLVNLPQIVVVGDQSSGKSSVLEPLPCDSGLCTRFATQIVFRQAVKERVVVSIVPSLESSQEHRHTRSRKSCKRYVSQYAMIIYAHGA